MVYRLTGGPPTGPPASTNSVAETEKGAEGGYDAKPLIVEAIAPRQRNAARVFKAQLARCLRERLPRGGKEEFFKVLHVGVALMDIVATRVAKGFGTGGAVVLTRFNAQLKKGIIDIDALWPRGKTRPFRD
jgi:hypothetical protein